MLFGALTSSRQLSMAVMQPSSHSKTSEHPALTRDETPTGTSQVFFVGAASPTLQYDLSILIQLSHIYIYILVDT